VRVSRIALYLIFFFYSFSLFSFWLVCSNSTARCLVSSAQNVVRYLGLVVVGSVPCLFGFSYLSIVLVLLLVVVFVVVDYLGVLFRSALHSYMHFALTTLVYSFLDTE